MKRENDPSAPSKALFNWYPGHMARALREIKQKLGMVDIVLEIRDARVPLSSGNYELNAQLGQKRKITVLNKANLADPDMVAKWGAWFDRQGAPYVFVNCFDKAAMKRVVGMARDIVEANRQAGNPEVEKKRKLRLMIVGLPNTGKSTVINQLANKNAAKVADRPGQTQIQQWIPVGEDVELMDTPGIMPPMIHHADQGLWLSAIHAVPDDISSEEDTAIFVVKHLLKQGAEEFLRRYQLKSPDIGVEEALLQIATLRGCLKHQGQPDLNRVYKLVLQEFRRGELGRTCFEAPPR